MASVQLSDDNLTPAQVARYEEIGRKAIIQHHPHIRAFIASRRFNDDGLIRGLITEYIRFAAIQDTKASDAEL